MSPTDAAKWVFFIFHTGYSLKQFSPTIRTIISGPILQRWRHVGTLNEVITNVPSKERGSSHKEIMPSTTFHIPLKKTKNCNCFSSVAEGKKNDSAT